jgi:hypothetical protein
MMNNILAKFMVGYTNTSVVYPSKYAIKRQILGLWNAGKEFFMWEGRFRRAVRLRLLALVLTLVLTWYALNPAPGTVRAVARETEPPDENRCEAKTTFRASRQLERIEAGVRGSSLTPPSRAEDADELEWPEIIDIV